MGGTLSFLIYAKDILMYKSLKLGQKLATLSWQKWVLTRAFGRDIQCVCFGKY